MKDTQKYCIETAAYAVPTPNFKVPGLFSFRTLLEVVGLLPAHLFFTLSKQDEQGAFMPIVTLHALATRFTQDEDGNLQKEILPIGTKSTDRLVMYQIFNEIGYTKKILADPEKEKEIRTTMETEKKCVGFTPQEEQDNAEAATKICGGAEYSPYYFLTLNARRTVYEGADDALALWKILNDFKESYNQNPAYYPRYGLGTSNSNTAFNTLAYISGVPIDGFAPFFTPGSKGILGSSEQLQPWLAKCQAIKALASSESEDIATQHSSITGAVVTPSSSDSEDLGTSVSSGIVSEFDKDHSEYKNDKWDFSEQVQDESGEGPQTKVDIFDLASSSDTEDADTDEYASDSTSFGVRSF